MAEKKTERKQCADNRALLHPSRKNRNLRRRAAVAAFCQRFCQNGKVNGHGEGNHGDVTHRPPHPFSHTAVFFALVRTAYFSNHAVHKTAAKRRAHADQRCKFAVIAAPLGRTLRALFRYIHAIVEKTLVRKHKQIGYHGNDRQGNHIAKQHSLNLKPGFCTPAVILSQPPL